MMPLLRRAIRLRVNAGSILIGVLAASMAVAVALAYQALTAARQRRAVSEAMVTQYAQLALWEYSRQARRDIDRSLQHALTGYAHPDRRLHAGDSTCDCVTLGDVEQWFEVSPGGDIRSRTGEILDRLRGGLSRIVLNDTREGGEGTVQLSSMPDDPTRVVATRWEPHLEPSGGRVGLVTTVASLARIFGDTHRRTALLPAVLVGDRDARSLVDLRIIDPRGNQIFASTGTVPGPTVVSTALLLEPPHAMTATASMTPAFMATLGPEHGAGPSAIGVLALVVLNAVLVVVGLWQLSRERELARLRSDFVAGVSHELRTPLAQIRLFSETLLLNRVRTPEESRRALEIIGQESQRLSQLVDNVLLFHRQARGVTNDQPIDVLAFAQEVADSFRPLAASRAIGVRVTSDGEPAVVRADAGSLRQVLLNLLDNAVKFGPPGQELAIGIRTTGTWVEMSVDDQGPGVAAVDRQRIFNPFHRGRETSGTGGAGIGLAVVRDIIVAQGGLVSVGDAPGGGARFVLSLPRVSSGSAAEGSS